MMREKYFERGILYVAVGELNGDFQVQETARGGERVARRALLARAASSIS